MKRIIIGSLCVLLVFLSSCKKESDCEKGKYATIQITNTSSNPYDIWIDDKLQLRLNGGAISDPIKVNEGNSRKFYAKQVSGFIFFPTEKTEYFAIVRCSKYSWIIP